MTTENQHPSTHAEGEMAVSVELWKALVGNAILRTAPGKGVGDWDCTYSDINYSPDGVQVDIGWSNKADLNRYASTFYHNEGDEYLVSWKALEPNLDFMLDLIGVKSDEQGTNVS
jgi:hypothetical protein